MTSLGSRTNPLSRSLPHFDIYGRQVTLMQTLSSMPVIETELKLPAGWSLEPSSKTQTQLFEERRQAAVPHASYDVDKDGTVGGQDLVVAKLFDKDQDGRLNTPERQAAESAVQSVRST